MPDDNRNGNMIFDGTFDDEDCRCNRNQRIGSDNTILYFLIVFLLLFTNFGARG